MQPHLQDTLFLPLRKVPSLSSFYRYVEANTLLVFTKPKCVPQGIPLKWACVFVCDITGQREKLENCLLLVATQGTEETSQRKGLWSFQK